MPHIKQVRGEIRRKKDNGTTSAFALSDLNNRPGSCCNYSDECTVVSITAKKAARHPSDLLYFQNYGPIRYSLMSKMYRSDTFTLMLFIILSVQPAYAQLSRSSSDAPAGTVFTPNIDPSVHVTRIESGMITIDGVLDDAGWRQAAIATNFSETFPGDQTKPPIEIETYLAYDESNFYIAYVIKDDPSAVRSNFSDRDQIWSDDYSGMLLDTNGDGQQMYFIAANPKGIQGDTRISNSSGEDVNFNVVYTSEGMVTDQGYQIEMAIPFRSLRFPNREEQVWRATFWITHPRDSRNTYSWAAIDRDNPCMTCNFGVLKGIQGVRSGRNLEFLPAITGAQSGAFSTAGDPFSGFDNGRINADPSLNVKYGITSDLTADLTINPDFSQIEADVAQIDVNSTTALFYPERRPFFQEGSDLFQTFVQAVYTRSINDPIVANKMTGRIGNTSVAYIGARDNNSPVLLPFEESSRLVEAGKSFSNIFRARHGFQDNSFIGALVTDRRLDDGGSGTTFGVDGSLRFLRNYRVSWQALASHTEEPNDTDLSSSVNNITFDRGRHTAAFDGEAFNGHAVYAGLGRDARHWNFEFNYQQMTPTFRADNGFIRQNDNRRVSMSQVYILYPEKIQFLDRVFGVVEVGRIWNFDNLKKEEWIEPAMMFRMKRQTNVTLFYHYGYERFRDTGFNGVRIAGLEFNSNFSEPVRVGFFIGRGRNIARNEAVPTLGKSTDFSAFGNIRPTQRLAIQPLFNYSKLTDSDTDDEFYSGYIARARITYQFTRRLLVRTVVQYNDFSESLEIDPLITYRINPFSAFHVGSTHDYNMFDAQLDGDPRFLRQSNRQFFFKFQYLFRV